MFGHFCLGRRALGLVNLDQPSVLVSRETRQSKWDVVTCQWSLLDENRVAVASNNKVEPLGLCNMSVKPTHMSPSTVLACQWSLLDENGVVAVINKKAELPTG
jgi:hypothetical protein